MNRSSSITRAYKWVVKEVNLQTIEKTIFFKYYFKMSEEENNIN